MGSVLSVHISGQGSKNKAITASLGKKKKVVKQLVYLVCFGA